MVQFNGQKGESKGCGKTQKHRLSPSETKVKLKD